MFFNFLCRTQKCTHEHFPTEKEYGYCPDCGEYIENKWYIVRCKCCGIKQKAIIRNGEIESSAKFCHNCGCNSYVVEKLPKINFIDINYAVVIRKAVDEIKVHPFIQSWVESKRTSDKPALLPQFQ